MNKRIVSIIYELNNLEKVITIDDLAKQFKVSTRTIRNDLNNINDILQENNLSLVELKNGGQIVRTKSFCTILTLISDGDYYSYKLSKEERKKIASALLINSPGYITLSTIADNLFVSRATVINDLEEIKRYIYKGHLKVLSHPNKGLRVEGKESDKRLFLMHLASHRSNTRQSDDIVSKHISVQAGNKITIQKIVFEQEHVHKSFLTDDSFENISEELEMNLNDDYDFFENLANHLESVLTQTPQSYPDNSLIDEVLEDNQEVLRAVNKNLNNISQYVNREITKIEIGYIAIHICAAIERKKNKEIAFHVIVACHAGIGTSQLLMEKLKKHFNFQIVDVISSHEAKNVDPQKADFIISTVPLSNCKLDYVIVSPLLSDEDYIRVGNKIDTLRDSRHLPSRIGEREISAKGLLEELSPVIHDMVPDAAPALMKEIRKVVRGYFNQSVEADAEIFSPYLHHLLPEAHIQLDVECDDWRDAVYKSAKPLLELGYIEERYIDSMIINIEENGPYIVLSKGFAFPHEGVEKGSVKVGMNLIRLKKPVNFGDEDFDPVEFVCCLSAVDHKTHLKAFFNLVNMLQNDDFKDRLRECKSSSAAAVIEKYEYLVVN